MQGIEVNHPSEWARFYDEPRGVCRYKHKGRHQSCQRHPHGDWPTLKATTEKRAPQRLHTLQGWAESRQNGGKGCGKGSQKIKAILRRRPDTPKAEKTSTPTAHA